MAGEFSLAVKLGDLNDYLRPSEACTEEPRLIKENGLAEEKRGAVSLADCLACSGCVTTSEVLLIEAHHHSKLKDALETSEKGRVCISISNISEAALMGWFSYTAEERPLFYQRLGEALGVRNLFSCDMAEYLATGMFMNASESDNNNGRGSNDASASKGSTCEGSTGGGFSGEGSTGKESTGEGSGDKESIDKESMAKGLKNDLEAANAANTKVLSNHCPGFVMYAEKNCRFLEEISRVAPNQIMQGLLVEKLMHNREKLREKLRTSAAFGLSVRGGLLCHSWYHVVINSCPDKKIECLRPEFRGLVDLSLTTDEFLRLLDELQAGDLVKARNQASTTASKKPEANLPEANQLEANQAGSNRGETRARGKTPAGVPRRKALPWDLATQLMLERRSGVYFSNTFVPGWEIDGGVASLGLNKEHLVFPDFVVATGLKNIMNKTKIKQDKKVVFLCCPFGCFNGSGNIDVYKTVPKSKIVEMYSRTSRIVPKNSSIDLALRQYDFRSTQPDTAASIGGSAAIRRDW